MIKHNQVVIACDRCNKFGELSDDGSINYADQTVLGPVSQDLGFRWIEGHGSQKDELLCRKCYKLETGYEIDDLASPNPNL